MRNFLNFYYLLLGIILQWYFKTILRICISDPYFSDHSCCMNFLVFLNTRACRADELFQNACILGTESLMGLTRNLVKVLRNTGVGVAQSV
jgi:hypothetical protein